MDGWLRLAFVLVALVVGAGVWVALVTAGLDASLSGLVGFLVVAGLVGTWIFGE